MTTDLF